jgi:hypothetical protein
VVKGRGVIASIDKIKCADDAKDDESFGSRSAIDDDE